MRLDVERRVALAVALWHCARELVGVGEDDLLAGARLDEAVMYRLGHWTRPWVLAFDNVLACRLLECPHHRLGCCAL